MKNKKGFTLVELLVVITVLGIITGLSWPAITRIREQNKTTKYKSYGDAMIAAAKLYVNSYEEDLFLYEDDLSEEQKEMGQCKFIMLYELMEHSLIKDFNDNGTSCNSEASFVRVIRKKGNYEYTYYLGCGKEHADHSLLTESEVIYTLPKENVINHADQNSCFQLTGTSIPVIKSWQIESKSQNFNSRDVQLKIKAEDEDNTNQELKVCITYSGDCNETDYLPYGTEATYVKDYTFPNYLTYNGDVIHLTVKVKDPSGNTTSENIPYTLYKECTDKHESGREVIRECSNICAGGTEDVRYLYNDSHTNHSCTSVEKTEDCYDTECCSIVTYNEILLNTMCSNECGGGKVIKEVKQIETSKKYPQINCTEKVVPVQTSESCNPHACTPRIVNLSGDAEFNYCKIGNKKYTDLDDVNDYCNSDIECWITTDGPAGASFTVETNYDYDQVQGYLTGRIYDELHGPEGVNETLCNGPLSECDYSGIIQGIEEIWFVETDQNGNTIKESNHLKINITKK